MNTAQVMEVLQQAADLGFEQVHLTGGEPLLRADFEKIYLFARRLGLRVLLFTNARLVTPHLAEVFFHIPPHVPIEVTVYGMRQESYEAATRAPGSFSQFINGLRLLHEYKIPFLVKSAILPSNRSEMDQFETGLPGIPWKIAKPTYSMNFDLRSRRDSPEKNSQIAAVRSSPQDIIAVAMRDTSRFVSWNETLATMKLQPPGDRLFQCNACIGKTVCVDAYGVAQPCISLRAPEMSYPLFKNDTLSEDRDPSPNKTTTHRTSRLKVAIDYMTRFRDLRATDPEYLRRCARCFLKNICEQCPAKSWAEHGSFDHPVEHLCEITHSLVRQLGWLDNAEHGWEIGGWHARIPSADR
jgi:sulfatase maturation enzyme AslB (radical SAM superfamily)